MFISGIAFSCGCFLALLAAILYSQETALKKPGRILAIIYLLLALWLFNVILLYTGLRLSSRFLLNFYYPIDLIISLCVNPLMYRYVRKLSTPGEPISSNRIQLQFIPALIVVGYVIHFGTLPETERINYLITEKIEHSAMWCIIIVAFYLQSFAYIYFCNKRMRSIGNSKVIVYQNSHLLKASWMKHLMWYNILALIIYLTIRISYSSLLYHLETVMILICILAVYLLSISFSHTGLTGIHSTYTSNLSDCQDEEDETDSETCPKVLDRKKTPENISEKPDNENCKTVIEAVREVMEKESPFLSARCPMSIIAELTGYSRETISFALKQEMNTSYTDFVNSYRVMHACNLMETGALGELTIEGIGKASGFGSKTNFFDAFKKVKNTTPLRYITQMEEESIQCEV